MTKLNQLQTKVFNAIQSELGPISIDNIVAEVGIVKAKIMHSLSALEQQKLIVGKRRNGTTYYELPLTKNYAIKSNMSSRRYF